MTGGELATTKAAMDLGKKMLTMDPAERALLLETAKDHPGIALAAEAYATRLAIRQTLLTKLYSPLGWLVGINQDYFKDQFSQDLAAKTDHVPESNLRTPAASVVIPAMQGLGYSLEEPNLKEMYLNLIATATDQTRDLDAHPAFADVIKQLSAREAETLLPLLQGRAFPIVRFEERETETSGYREVLSNVIALVDEETDEYLPAATGSLWVQNWVRLGLVTVSFSVWMAEDESYLHYEEHPELLQLRSNAGEGVTYTFSKGLMTVSEFGRRFAAAVSDGGGEAAAMEPH